jgi:hypothetical protein
MLRRVALVRPDVSEEPSASFIRVTRNGELGTTLAATSKRRKLRRRAARRNIPEDTILHSHRRENLKSYTTSSDNGQKEIGDHVTSRIATAMSNMQVRFSETSVHILHGAIYKTTTYRTTDVEPQILQR